MAKPQGRRPTWTRPDVILQANGAQMGLKRERESVSRLGPGHAKIARSERPLDCDVCESLTPIEISVAALCSDGSSSWKAHGISGLKALNPPSGR